MAEIGTHENTIQGKSINSSNDGDGIFKKLENDGSQLEGILDKHNNISLKDLSSDKPLQDDILK